MLNDLVALLEECLCNGDQGPETLYAWFLGERALIERVVQAGRQKIADLRRLLGVARETFGPRLQRTMRKGGKQYHYSPDELEGVDVSD